VATPDSFPVRTLRQPIRGRPRRAAHTGLFRLARAVLLLVLVAGLFASRFDAQEKKREVQHVANAPVTVDEAGQLEAVITTDLGVIRFEFLPAKAPKHVLQFIDKAKSGFYDGSAFHRVIVRGLIQGGDPLLKDPNTPRSRWGSGGLNQIADESSDLKHVRGTVSTVAIPGQPNSGGVQFFICSSPQPQLDGQFSAFGQVTEGIDVVDRISMAAADSNLLTTNPVRIASIKIERKPVEPFKDATPDQMRVDVLLKTSFGDITLEMDPDIAPEHVRNFLKLVESGWYNHTAFHRVVPGFVVQGGIGATRAGGAPHRADKWVHKLKPEFSKREHIRGTLSMARGDAVDSAETSFFLVLGPAPHLDGKYTIFGKIVDGFDVLDQMVSVPRQGETPIQRIELIEAAIKQ
jgi:cyclophilin family peptidyl-prolyl cis-trans isomerase